MAAFVLTVKLSQSCEQSLRLLWADKHRSRNDETLSFHNDRQVLTGLIVPKNEAGEFQFTICSWGLECEVDGYNRSSCKLVFGDEDERAEFGGLYPAFVLFYDGCRDAENMFAVAGIRNCEAVGNADLESGDIRLDPVIAHGHVDESLPVGAGLPGRIRRLGGGLFSRRRGG